MLAYVTRCSQKSYDGRAYKPLDRLHFHMNTPILRVTKRLGWLPSNPTYEKAHQLLGALGFPGRYYPLYINLIRLGREICVAVIPHCEIRPLTDVCEYSGNNCPSLNITPRLYITPRLRASKLLDVNDFLTIQSLGVTRTLGVILIG